MSTIERPTGASARERAPTSTASDDARARTIWRISMLVTVVVLVWSTGELIDLASKHTIGPEVYGVAVAAVTVVAGVLSLALLWSTRRRALATTAVLVLWAVIAIGGVAGMVAHVVGPGSGHGPVDTRPRPILAPLTFTTLALLGGVTLFYGQRAKSRRVPGIMKEE